MRSHSLQRRVRAELSRRLGGVAPRAAWFAVALELAAMPCRACAPEEPARDAPQHDRESAQALASSPIRLLVIADLEGVVEPCSCGGRPAGGADRLVAAVDRLRSGRRHALVVAAGNSLHQPDAPAGPPREQDAWKADTASAVLVRLGVDVLAPGPADLELGAERLQALARGNAAVVLVGNGVDRVPVGPLLVGTLRKAGNIEVGVTGASHASEVAIAEARSLRDRGADLVIAVVHGDETAALRTAEQLEAAIVIHTGASGHDPVATRVGKRSLLVRAGKHAEGLTAIDVWPAGNDPVVEHVALDATAPRDPGVRALLDGLFARINAHNASRAGSGAPLDEGTDGYAGSEACAACHAPAYFWWRRTAHGRAFETLVARARQFDLDCVGCHVTGLQPRAWGLVGGIEHRKGVGCESCHGPGAEHADNPRPPHRSLRRDVPEMRCVGCHDRDHSRGFEYAASKVKLLAPGHGGGATASGAR
jgi:hypothetical protein